MHALYSLVLYLNWLKCRKSDGSVLSLMLLLLLQISGRGTRFNSRCKEHASLAVAERKMLNAGVIFKF